MIKSFIKAFKSKDNNKYNESKPRKDSFSDRFCDDLSEVLLSYLSFEDKIRLECVSHQFQRLLFNKQYVLQVFESGLKTQNSLNELIVYTKSINFYDKEITLKAFKSVLKKCKSINKIEIKRYDINQCENRGKVLQIIAKYVKHLKSIEFCFKDINEKVLLDFGEKCGQKLQNINFCDRIKYSHFKFNQFLKLCPNIRSLTNIRLFDIIENNDLLVPKLISINGLTINSDINLFENFVNKTQNLLKFLGIINNDFYCNEDSPLILFKKIAKFVNLEELRLSRLCCDDFEILNNILHCIGLKCKKLKKLYLRLTKLNGNLRQVQILYINKNLDFLTSFVKIQHLDLNIWSILDINLLQNFTQLTHLKLNFEKLCEHSFTDIDLYLPQLSHLCICVNYDITDYELKPFTKLKQLKCLIINIQSFRSNSHSLTDEGICQIINNCPEITSIRFNTKPKITLKTMDALISLAERKPFSHFVHSFGRKSLLKTDFNYLKFISNEKYKNLPKNLNIIPFDSNIFGIYGKNDI